MAIFHFSVQVISRGSGRSAVAAAAYRAGEQLHDERLDRDHDFRARSGVEHSEILLPEGAPEQWRMRERLWNDVEAFEIGFDDGTFGRRIAQENVIEAGPVGRLGYTEAGRGISLRIGIDQQDLKIVCGQRR